MFIIQIVPVQRLISYKKLMGDTLGLLKIKINPKVKDSISYSELEAHKLPHVGDFSNKFLKKST